MCVIIIFCLIVRELSKYERTQPKCSRKTTASCYCYVAREYWEWYNTFFITKMEQHTVLRDTFKNITILSNEQYKCCSYVIMLS